MVFVPALSLLGRGQQPAELEGYGPIPATIARKWAAHAPSFTRLLTHPETGAVLSIGRVKYKVPADLRRWIQVRDRTCRFPGCNTPAAGCELDHTKDRAAGGTTDYCNLACFCRKHHRLKHKTRWKTTQPDPGTLTFTSPAGRSYTTTPDPPPDSCLPVLLNEELSGQEPLDGDQPEQKQQEPEPPQTEQAGGQTAGAAVVPVQAPKNGGSDAMPPADSERVHSEPDPEPDDPPPF